MNVLGLIGFAWNPAACLLVDGKLVAFAEEERFTRLKSRMGFSQAKPSSTACARKPQAQRR
jgi:carbamoyltransferase